MTFKVEAWQRRTELKAIDTAKLEGRTLEDLLAHQGQNHVENKDGRKVMTFISNYLLIYFGVKLLIQQFWQYF